MPEECEIIDYLIARKPNDRLRASQIKESVQFKNLLKKYT